MSSENSDRWSLKGKKALVTGGTKGIGAAMEPPVQTMLAAF